MAIYRLSEADESVYRPTYGVAEALGVPYTVKTEFYPVCPFINVPYDRSNPETGCNVFVLTVGGAGPLLYKWRG